MGKPNNAGGVDGQSTENMFGGDMGRREAIGGILKLLGLKVTTDAANAMGQDPAVAIVTPNNNPKTVGTPEKIEKSGMTLNIELILEELKKSAEELKKGKVSIEELQVVLGKLILNEGSMKVEVSSALKSVSTNLKRTYDSLKSSDPKKEKLHDLSLKLNDLLGALAEDVNLIKALRIIVQLGVDFPRETNGIKLAYFKTIIDFIDKPVDKVLTDIAKLGKEWGSKPSPELENVRSNLQHFLGRDVSKVEVPIIPGANLVKNPNLRVSNNTVADWTINDKGAAQLKSGKDHCEINLLQEKGYVYLKQNIKLLTGDYRLILPIISESVKGAGLLEVKIGDNNSRIKRNDNNQFMHEFTIDKPTEIEVVIFVSKSEVKKSDIPAKGNIQVTYGPVEHKKK